MSMTTFLPTGSGRHWTLTKVHNRPDKKLYNRLSNEENVELNQDQLNDGQLKYLLSDPSSSSEEDLAPELVEMARLRNYKHLNVSHSSYIPETTNHGVVEWEIEQGDTLQSLSIKYGCKVSELKRKNKIMNDQEFFGLRTIKIPVKKHSYLEEELLKRIEEKAPNRSRLSTSPRKLRIGDSLFGENRPGAATFIQQMDTDLENMRQTIKTRKDTLEEVTQVLTCKSIMPLGADQEEKVVPKVKTKFVVFLIILGLLVLPIVIFLWVKYQ